ncbi:hypothetical protein CTEN210_12045 [Chaetoceros tenuissimus]|uniref:F-box domain-containing protein n=1 Tax=Chaetoceros tenuissimus TaxID=426638 RepID=A0AAD3D0R9_9STRA|nr:hypothetical protein CTEN210_12045 [Chaetoceros tenuissimus]
MTTNRKVSESGRKRARTEDASSCSPASYILVRANKISNKLSVLLKEFPELKFIIDFEHLQANVETAILKYVEEKEAKKHEAQLLMNYNKDSIPVYSLPDEVLSNCLSYVAKGHYGSIGLVSKKFRNAYKAQFGQDTAYLEMATSVNLAKHCLSKLCRNSEEKDEILKAAAVNGNVDILRAAVKDGYDLFPLVEMITRTIFPYYDSDEDDEEDMYDGTEFTVYFTDDDGRKYSLKPQNVNLSKLVERGHLHVLKYLHEELGYFLGLQRYCKPAIEHGKLEILQWLEDTFVLGNEHLRIGVMDNGSLKPDFDHCECAIKIGNVDSLKWLQEVGCYNIFGGTANILIDAIESKSTKMIQYCFDLGYNDLNSYGVEGAIRLTKSVEVFRLMYELGYEFGDMKDWCSYGHDIAEYFEIMKFLRSISVPWDDDIMKAIVEFGTLEMIQYAHKDGCPWTTHGEEYLCLLRNKSWSLDKLYYLRDNGCIFDYEHSRLSDVIFVLKAKKKLRLLDYFVGKNARFDYRLFMEIFKSSSKPWFEGLSYLLEKGKDVENFTSLEEVFRIRHDIDGIKYFHSLGLPWCLDSSRNTIFLSQIACHIKLDDVKWVYENGCKGGNLVPYVKEEWNKYGIRHESKWKANQAFFAENGLLDECFLEKIGLKKLDSKNVQEIGDAQLALYHGVSVSRERSFFEVDFCSLKNLIAHGFKFRCEREKEIICQEAYEECCECFRNEEVRKRLALFVGMGVRDL